MFEHPLQIVAIGHALPQNCVSNAQLIADKNLDSSDEWIRTRTGITQRYLCNANENLVTLATAAAQEALTRAKVSAKDIDAILVATCTATQQFPSVAAQVAEALNIAPFVLDINAACSGFIYGLQVAQGLAETGAAKNILLIGAETFSSFLDWTDRTTCVLFGDGAGAVLLQPTNAGNGLQAIECGSEGKGATDLSATDYVHMNGREVFKSAVKRMGSPSKTLFQNAGVTLQDVDWLIPHQANIRILEAAAKASGIAPKKVITTVGQHANTSAASIPLAWYQAQQNGQLKTGQLVYLQAFGAGFTYAEALIRF